MQLINQQEFAKQKLANYQAQVQMPGIGNAQMPRGYGVQSLPPIEERNMAPAVIRAGRAPHLSPVGSLTNLLTDLSSTGFRRKPPKDMNKEIPKIMANHAEKRK